MFAGWQDEASSDIDQILKWAAAWPDCWWALATGEGSGVVVVDVDVKGQADGWASLKELGCDEQLAPHPAVETPSGGFHLYCEAPHGYLKTVRGLVEGVDIRATGGLVILPPSPGYKWSRSMAEGWLLGPVPERILQLLEEEASPPTWAPSSPPQHISDGRLKAYGEKGLEGNVRDILHSQPGEQNDMIYRASYSTGRLIASGCLDRSAAEQALLKAAHESGYCKRDGIKAALRSIDSGLKDGLKTPRYPAESSSPPVESPRGPRQRIAESVEQYRVTTDRSATWLQMAEELSRAKRTSTTVDGLDAALGGGLPPASVTLLCGAPGSGKTSLLMWMLRQRLEEGRPGIMWSLELMGFDFLTRMCSIRHRLSWGEVRDGMHPEQLGETRDWLVGNPNFYLIERTQVRSIEHMSRVVERICQQHGEAPLLGMDYIQLAKRPTREEDARLLVGDSGWEMLELTNEHGVTVVALSSVGRAAYKLGSKDEPPHLSDTLAAAKESGDLEYNAQAVLTIAIKRQKSRDGLRYGWLSLAKNRFTGEEKNIPVAYDGLNGCFMDSEREEVEQRIAESDEAEELVRLAVSRHKFSNQLELARYCRLRKATVSRVLARLSDAEVIQKQGGQYVLLQEVQERDES
jgi:hypothetical protein